MLSSWTSLFVGGVSTSALADMYGFLIQCCVILTRMAMTLFVDMTWWIPLQSGGSPPSSSSPFSSSSSSTSSPLLPLNLSDGSFLGKCKATRQSRSCGSSGGTWRWVRVMKLRCRLVLLSGLSHSAWQAAAFAWGRFTPWGGEEEEEEKELDGESAVLLTKINTWMWLASLRSFVDGVFFLFHFLAWSLTRQRTANP